MKDKYSESENAFIALCSACPPNLELIRQKLASEIDPNAFTEYTFGNKTQICREFLIKDVLFGFGFEEDSEHSWGKEYGCRYLPDIIRAFLDAGFDPSLDEGRAGSQALGNLIFCARDEYLIPAAQILLDAGADPRMMSSRDEPYEDALEMIRFEASYCHTESDTHESKILYQLYEFIRDYLLKRDFGPDVFTFLKACHEHPVDFGWIEKQLKNGLDVNASFTTHTSWGDPYTQFLIHEILDGFGWYELSVDQDNGFGCKDLPKLLELLFEYGLDLSLDEERTGARALYNLILCKYDEYVLEAARLLVQHGANAHIMPHEFSKTVAEYLKDRATENKGYINPDVKYQKLLDVIACNEQGN